METASDNQANVDAMITTRSYLSPGLSRKSPYTVANVVGFLAVVALCAPSAWSYAVASDDGAHSSSSSSYSTTKPAMTPSLDAAIANEDDRIEAARRPPSSVYQPRKRSQQQQQQLRRQQEEKKLEEYHDVANRIDPSLLIRPLAAQPWMFDGSYHNKNPQQNDANNPDELPILSTQPPTNVPTRFPTVTPTTGVPSLLPTSSTLPTLTVTPTSHPSSAPSHSSVPTQSSSPSHAPSSSSVPSAGPSIAPTVGPSIAPTVGPSLNPSSVPTTTSAPTTSPQPTTNPDPLGRIVCGTNDNGDFFASSSAESGSDGNETTAVETVEVTYRYEIETTVPLVGRNNGTTTGGTEAVGGEEGREVLPALERAITDLLLPLLFDDECRARATTESQRRLRQGQTYETAMHGAGGEKMTWNGVVDPIDERRTTTRRRLAVVGLSNKPDDTIQSGEACQVEQSDAANTCSVVEGGLRLFVITESETDEKTRILDALKAGMGRNSTASDLVASHAAIVRLTFLENPTEGVEGGGGETTAVTPRSDPNADSGIPTFGYVLIASSALIAVAALLLYATRRNRDDEDEDTNDSSGKEGKESSGLASNSSSSLNEDDIDVDDLEREAMAIIGVEAGSKRWQGKPRSTFEDGVDDDEQAMTEVNTSYEEDTSMSSAASDSFDDGTGSPNRANAVPSLLGPRSDEEQSPSHGSDSEDSFTRAFGV